MSWARRAARALLPLALVLPSAARAQSLPTRELGVEGLLAASEPAFGGGGIYVALRPSPRMRLAATASAGALRGAAAFRGELLGHFLLAPVARRGTGLYLGGGAAIVAAGVTRGYLVALVGLEARPAARSGWFIEAGVGGGARLAAGWRVRWVGRGRRPI